MSTRLETTEQAVVRAAYSGEAGERQLGNPDWQLAHSVRIDREWSGKSAPEHRHAEAQILWTDESLNIRFVCRQTEPLIVNSKPQLDKKTLGLWDKDVCEIFVAPNVDTPERYFEFEAAPTGEWVDLGIQITPAGRQTNWDYVSGMRAETSLSENMLIIVIRIPWSECLPKPQRGDAWRCNLFRCIGTGNERYLAWRPTHTPEPYFHVPEVFGRLEFV